MNFLSHYYFVRHTADPYLALGSVLPDMVRNHRKDWNLHPSRVRERYEGESALFSIFRGWELHMEADRQFHSSEFFRKHSSGLRKEIASFITELPFRPFFLAHVALELLLDSLLIIHKKVDADNFYLQLSGCSPPEVTRFIALCQIPGADSFLPWFDEFRNSRYLFTYSRPERLAYALDRIGQRVWQAPFPGGYRRDLEAVLSAYRAKIEKEYLHIFEEITYYLRRHTAYDPF